VARSRYERRVAPGWSALIFVAVIAAVFALVAALFAGTFGRAVPVTLTSDRSGLVMESGGKVKMNGVEVGRVAAIDGRTRPVSMKLEINPEQIRYIPANVEPEIKASTAFGVKYVDLVYPVDPSDQRLRPGAVLRSRNVSTEVNTVFQNLVGVVRQVDPVKLNATLTALAEGVRGQGERIGEATTAATQVLRELNPRMPLGKRNLQSLKEFSDAYGAAAQDIIDVLDAASTTSVTVARGASDLDRLLLNVIGLADSGIEVIGSNQDNLVQAVNVLEPTTNLLHKYSPGLTCMLLGAKWFLDNGGYQTTGGSNGRSLVGSAGILLADDRYRYPDNLPIVAAKGGPGGKPGCGSLPDASKNFPVRQLITNTGWGTGMDVRPNPGIAHPWWMNFFPVTRAVPEPPYILGEGPPAIGPVPYPGAPAYGAPAPPGPPAPGGGP